MSDINIINDLEPELKKKLEEIHQMLSRLIDDSSSPLSKVIITSNQLRKDLGISPRTEQNWINEGILKRHKQKGKNYYLAEEVKEAIMKAE